MIEREKRVGGWMNDPLLIQCLREFDVQMIEKLKHEFVEDPRLKTTLIIVLVVIYRLTLTSILFWI